MKRIVVLIVSLLILSSLANNIVAQEYRKENKKKRKEKNQPIQPVRNRPPQVKKQDKPSAFNMIGKVIENATQRPLRDVLIEFEGVSDITDSLGNFKIPFNQNKTVNVNFTLDGYKTFSQILNTNDNGLIIKLEAETQMTKIETKALTSLDIDVVPDELLQIKVTTASKKSEAQSDAPSALSVITSREIEQFGANNLQEVLDRIVGAYSLGSNLYRQNVVSMRGDLLTHFNNHVLIMINGRPIREAIYGGTDMAIFAAFPLEGIERIEVIRGPGSVLYGTNAYTGVINILTKVEDNHLIAKGGGGALGTNYGSVVGGIKRGDFRITAGGRYFKDNGWNFDARDETGKRTPNADSSLKYGQQHTGLVLNTSYKGLQLNAFIGMTEQTNLGPTVHWHPDSLNLTKINANRMFFDLGYKHKFSNRWQTTANVTSNLSGTGFKLALRNPTFTNSKDYGDYYAQSNDIIGEITNYYSFNEKLNWTLGGTVYYMSGNAVTDTVAGTTKRPDVPKYTETWFNAYTQLDYKPFKQLKLTGGVQMNKAQGVDVNFVPRIGAIINATDKIGAKILYGQAFRAAFRGENNINVPGILLGPAARPEVATNLLPEVVSTIDVQAFYNTPKYQLSATYFNSTQTNLISRIPGTQATPPVVVPVGTAVPATYTNAGKLFSQGIEIEAKTTPINSLFITASLSYQTNTREDIKKKVVTGEDSVVTIENFTTMPNIMFKLGITYRYKKIFSVGVFNTMMGEAHDDVIINALPRITGTTNPNIPGGGNPTAAAYNLLTAKVSFNILKAFNLSSKYDLMLNLYGYNLLDAKVYYPEFNRRRTNTLPGRQGMSLFGEVQFQF